MMPQRCLWVGTNNYCEEDCMVWLCGFILVGGEGSNVWCLYMHRIFMPNHVTELSPLYGEDFVVVLEAIWRVTDGPCWV